NPRQETRPISSPERGEQAQRQLYKQGGREFAFRQRGRLQMGQFVGCDPPKPLPERMELAAAQALANRRAWTKGVYLVVKLPRQLLRASEDPGGGARLS